MLFDINSLFSGAIAADGTRTGQAITATAVSTNVMDTRQPNGTPALVNLGLVSSGVGAVYLNVVVGTAFTLLTSLTITLESSSTSDLATSPTVHFSGTVALAGLTANTKVLCIPLPVGDYKRYVGVRYTVTGTNPGAGTVTAYLSMDPNVNPIYPSGFTVDA